MSSVLHVLCTTGTLSLRLRLALIISKSHRVLLAKSGSTHVFVYGPQSTRPTVMPSALIQIEPFNALLKIPI